MYGRLLRRDDKSAFSALRRIPRVGCRQKRTPLYIHARGRERRGGRIESIHGRYAVT